MDKFSVYLILLFSPHPLTPLQKGEGSHALSNPSYLLKSNSISSQVLSGGTNIPNFLNITHK